MILKAAYHSFWTTTNTPSPSVAAMKGDATGDGGFDMVVVYLYTLWGHGGSPSSPLSLFIIDYYGGRMGICSRDERLLHLRKL